MSSSSFHPCPQTHAGRVSGSYDSLRSACLITVMEHTQGTSVSLGTCSILYSQLRHTFCMSLQKQSENFQPETGQIEKSGLAWAEF